MTGIPLTPRAPEQRLAWYDNRPVTVRQFLGHAEALAQTLPPSRWLVNLCRNRYHFMAGFAAALMRGQTSILPPNKTAALLQSLARKFPGLCLLADEAVDCPPEIPLVRLPVLEADGDGPAGIPKIPAGHAAALAFTSGSTGEPQPHVKTWQSMVTIARNTGRRLTPGEGPEPTVVATVPPQHMYGLEASILLPLQARGTLHDSTPFYPEDIREALTRTPGRHLLVTTPVHLKACLDASVELPGLEGVVSATAPLPREWAARVEAEFDTQVHEIYGCTEAGSLATRRTVNEDTWTLLYGIGLTGDAAEGRVEAAYLERPVLLPDVIANRGEGRFELLGRGGDLVNIAGKRISLGELNFRLNDIPGVVDGVYIPPPANGPADRRLAALVVTRDLTEADIQAALRLSLDPVFLPRPLRIVERLPRTRSGKLPRAALLEMLETGGDAP